MASPNSSSNEFWPDAQDDLAWDEECRCLAQRLREEAARLADAAPPQHAYRQLIGELRKRRAPYRRMWQIAAAGIVASAAAVTLVVLARSDSHRAVVPGPQNTAAIVQAPQPQSENLPVEATRSAQQDSWPFLSEQGFEHTVQGEPILSDAQRIEMLEKALARYRAALEAQQQRIRELERELETLRARVQSAAKDP